MTNLEVLLSRRAKLMEKLNGILAGMCDDDETEITNKESCTFKQIQSTVSTYFIAKELYFIVKENLKEIYFITKEIYFIETTKKSIHCSELYFW